MCMSSYIHFHLGKYVKDRLWKKFDKRPREMKKIDKKLISISYRFYNNTMYILRIAKIELQINIEWAGGCN